jgi:hypothetical protein
MQCSVRSPVTSVKQLLRYQTPQSAGRMPESVCNCGGPAVVILA